MDIQLETRIVLQLQEIAKQQNREISEILVDAIAQYVEEQTNETAFRQSVREVLTEHQWLLDKLSEQ